MKKTIAFLIVVVLWNAAIAQKKDPNFVRFTTDDQLILSEDNGAVTRFDLSTMAVIESYKIDPDPKAKLVSMSLSPDRKTALALFRNTNLHIWEVAGGKILTTITKAREADFFDHYVVFVRDGAIFRYDLATASEEKLGGSSFILPPDRLKLATVDGSNMSVYGTDPAPKTFPLPPDAFKIDVSRNGKYVATATMPKGGDFTWTILSADDGSKVFEKKESLGSNAEAIKQFGFTWNDQLMFSLEKRFPVPGDLPKVGLFNVGESKFQADITPDKDSEPDTWTRGGVVILGSNVTAPDKSWMLIKDPDDKYTPATEAGISPDGGKLIVVRKKTSSMEWYNLKDTEAMTQKSMIVSIDYQKPKLVKVFPIP